LLVLIALLLPSAGLLCVAGVLLLLYSLLVPPLGLGILLAWLSILPWWVYALAGVLLAAALLTEWFRGPPALRFLARGLIGVLVLLPLALAAVVLNRELPWPIWVALLVAVAAAALASFALRRPAPVRHLQWDGLGHTFRFLNPGYARRFEAMNLEQVLP
jgi:hypothetical protein